MSRRPFQYRCPVCGALVYSNNKGEEENHAISCKYYDATAGKR